MRKALASVTLAALAPIIIATHVVAVSLRVAGSLVGLAVGLGVSVLVLLATLYQPNNIVNAVGETLATSMKTGQAIFLAPLIPLASLELGMLSSAYKLLGGSGDLSWNG